MTRLSFLLLTLLLIGALVQPDRALRANPTIQDTPLPGIMGPRGYLPITLRGEATPKVALTSTSTLIPTATPTRTPTATATSTPTTVPIIEVPNGNFEQGATSWAGTTAAIVTTFGPGITAHSGTHAVRFLDGNTGDPDRVLDQGLIVPNTAPYLTYWLWVVSSEPLCGFDRGGVGVFPVGLGPAIARDVFDLCAATQTNGWVRHSIDLTAHSGKAITAELTVGSTGTTANSTLYIDDVSFSATP